MASNVKKSRKSSTSGTKKKSTNKKDIPNDTEEKQKDLKENKEIYVKIVHFVTQISPPMIAFSDEKGAYSQGVIDMFKKAYEKYKDMEDGKERFNNLVNKWQEQFLGGVSLNDSDYFIDWWEHIYYYRHKVKVKNEKTGEMEEQIVETPSKLDSNYNFLSEDTISEVLNDLKSVEEYAYILHDKDVIDLAELKEQGAEPPNYADYAPRVSVNKIVKSPHWHIAIKFKRSFPLSCLVKRFGFEGREQFFKKVGSKNNLVSDAWFDTVEYLTHESPKEQDLGKFRYDDSLVVANFDWRNFIDTHVKADSISEYKDIIKRQVSTNGLSLYRAAQLYKGTKPYAEVLKDLPSFRYNYLRNIAEKPPHLINIYIFGMGGTGKDIISDWLAFFLHYGLQALEFETLKGDYNMQEYSFPLTDVGLGLSGYDGQTSIIYSDKRAVDLLNIFDGRGGTFAQFDPYTKDTFRNVKYSSVRTICKYQIVNDIEEERGNPYHYRTFLNNLAGEYTDRRTGTNIQSEDKSQSYRRFPIIIRCTEEGYTLLLNNYWLSNATKRDFFNYKETYYNGIANRILKCGKSPKEINNLMYRFLKPIIDAVHNFEDNFFNKSIDYDTTYIGMSEFEILDYKIENDISFIDESKQKIVRYSDDIKKRMKEINSRSDEILKEIRNIQENISINEKFLNSCTNDSDIDYYNSFIKDLNIRETNLKIERDSILEKKLKLDVKMCAVNSFIIDKINVIDNYDKFKKFTEKFEDEKTRLFNLIKKNKESLEKESYFNSFLPVIRYARNVPNIVPAIHIDKKLKYPIVDVLTLLDFQLSIYNKEVIERYCRDYEKLKIDIKKSENFDIYMGYYQIAHQILNFMNNLQ